jgi:hypothetical protein
MLAWWGWFEVEHVEGVLTWPYLSVGLREEVKVQVSCRGKMIPEFSSRDLIITELSLADTSQPKVEVQVRCVEVGSR